MSIIDVDKYYTLTEITELYDIQISTLSAYIGRGQVIPPDRVKRIGRTVLVEKAWVDRFYKDKKL